MKLTIKKFSSNILGLYKICDDKGYIKYTAEQESLGKVNIYEDEKQIGCIKRKLNASQETFEFYLNHKRIGKLIKEVSLKKTKYYLSFEGFKDIQIHYSHTEYQILDSNEECIMKFSQEPSFDSKTYSLKITEDDNEKLCILIAFAIVMAI